MSCYVCMHVASVHVATTAKTSLPNSGRLSMSTSHLTSKSGPVPLTRKSLDPGKLSKNWSAVDVNIDNGKSMVGDWLSRRLVA